ncbi:unnamed protein product [Amoebophrya sp. A120]|nr:unnamed protein product [Amoebophrya sp. A120]|eukprot:GSA120T00012229001.1
MRRPRARKKGRIDQLPWLSIIAGAAALQLLHALPSAGAIQVKKTAASKNGNGATAAHQLKKHKIFTRATANESPHAAPNTPVHDNPYPAVHDRNEADFVEDTDKDDGSWQANNRYDTLRHSIAHAKELAAKAKEDLPGYTLRYEESQKHFGSFSERKKSLDEEVKAIKELEDAEFEKLVEIKKQSYEEEILVKKKKKLLEQMIENQRKREADFLKQKQELEQKLQQEEKDLQAQVDKSSKELQQAEENFEEVERMIKSSDEYDKTSKSVDVLAAKRKELVKRQEDFEREYKQVVENHEAAEKDYKFAKQNVLDTKETEEALNADLDDAAAKLSEYSTSDTNPWSGLMGGDVQEPEKEPKNSSGRLFHLNPAVLILLLAGLIALSMVYVSGASVSVLVWGK